MSVVSKSTSENSPDSALDSLADDTNEELSESFGRLTFAENLDKLQDQESGKANSSVVAPKTDTKVVFDIINAHTVYEGKSKHVMYSILVLKSPDLKLAHAIIERRYSDFELLNKALLKKYGSLLQEIAFPKKLLTGNFKPDTIARRSRAFEQYLRQIYSVVELRYSSEFASFLYQSDLTQAFDLLRRGAYTEALPFLQTVVLVQRHMLGDNHPKVLQSLCALIAAASATEQDRLAQSCSEAALPHMEHNDVYKGALLQLSIRLCWKLGKDKTDLESQLRSLRDSGQDISNIPSLMEIVLQNHPS